MKKTYLQKLLLAIGILLSFTYSKTALASHIYGADLRYEWVSDSTYRIIVSLYGDCGMLSLGAYRGLPASTPQVCVFDGATFNSTIYLTIDTPLCGHEVIPFCAGDTTTCTGPSYPVPGVNQFVYSGLFTLPYGSANWRFVYSGNNGSTAVSYSCPGTSLGSGSSSPASSGRTTATTNLVPGSSVQLIDSLNSLAGHNSSVELTVAQQTLFCFGQHNEYDPGVADPDGDSVVVSLAAPGNGTGGCGTVGGPTAYTGNAWPGMPISENEPLQVLADSFAFYSNTGKIKFHPNSLQRSVVVYNIDEYRGGVKIGTSQREMTVLVVVCGSLFPCLGLGTLGVTKPDNSGSVVLFPNPANEVVTVKTAKLVFNYLLVTNTLGQVVLRQEVNGTNFDVAIKNLPDGMYYMTLRGKQGSVVKNFVKQ